jgi:nucleotide-binding universal stress UspA family protein
MRRILFATDGSDDATNALDFLERLPLAEGTRIYIISVLSEPMLLTGPAMEAVYPPTESLDEIRKTERDLAEEILQEAAGRLCREGLDVRTAVRFGEPAREIINTAREWEVDLVVVGSRGLTGLDGLLLGSVARNVAKHASRPVLVARAPRFALRDVVVATDGSEHANLAVEQTGRLPLPSETRLTVTTVVRPYTPLLSLRRNKGGDFSGPVEEVRRRQFEQATTLVSASRDRLAADGREVHTEVREGDPASRILEVVTEQEADLVVAGARGTGVIENLLVGSVADRLLKEAGCSVLLVR